MAPFFPRHAVPHSDAARFLGVKAAYLAAEIKAGRLPGLIAGETILVHVPTVAACLAQRAGARVSVRLVDDMLADLESTDPQTRLRGAMDLAKAVGAGLALQRVSEEDAEHGIGRDFADLISRAAATGDREAVAQLRRVITTNPLEASTTPREGTAAARRGAA